MRSIIPIVICWLYALSAVNGTSFSMSGNAEVQQDSATVAEPQHIWPDDKSDDDDKGGKVGRHDHNNDNVSDADECALRSVSILIAASTFDIPCLGAGSVVNLDGLLPAALPSLFPSASAESSFVASSSVESSSAASPSDACSTTDSTTTSSSTTTTTTTTSSSSD
jgi:hypothetical protein